ncbi:MAG: permease, partial [Dysgonamonadaceae bacterium]|nr:permease [Dysgonamonadaceae bacterium]
RFAACFLCGAAAGICVRLFFKDKHFFRFTKFENLSSRDTDPNPLIRYLKNFGRNVKATGGYFLVGIALSTLFQRYVPQEAFGKLFGTNRGFGVLMAATIGVPLYVCGGGTIPLLQAWLMNGMTMGSAASFMITGPASKITNLGALKIVLGIKHFAFYWLFVIAFALLSGLALDYALLRG